MSTTMTLTIDELEEIKSPTWNDVMKWIRELDGNEHSTVTLFTEEEKAILVGGGNEGRFIVSFYPDFGGQISYFLSDPSKGDDSIEVVVQSPAKYPIKWVMNEDAVLEVVKSFFNTGQMPQGYTWEES